MIKIEKKIKLKYYKFLNALPKKLNKLYFSKLKGKFKLNNKSKLLTKMDSKAASALSQNGIFSIKWLLTSEAWKLRLIISNLVTAKTSDKSTYLSSTSFNTEFGTIGKLSRRITGKNGKKPRLYVLNLRTELLC